MCVWEVEVVINGRGENGKGRGNTGYEQATVNPDQGRKYRYLVKDRLDPRLHRKSSPHTPVALQPWANTPCTSMGVPGEA